MGCFLPLFVCFCLSVCLFLFLASWAPPLCPIAGSKRFPFSVLWPIAAALPSPPPPLYSKNNNWEPGRVLIS